MPFQLGGGELIAMALILGLYFLPAVVAAVRGLPNAVTVFVVNLLLGWSVVGWVLALVWATGRRRAR